MRDREHLRRNGFRHLISKVGCVGQQNLGHTGD